MKNKRIVSGLLAFVMVFTTLLGSVMPAFAVEGTGDNMVTISFDVDGKCETPAALTVEKGTALQDKLPHPEYTDANGDTFYAFSWLKEKGNLDTEVKEFEAVAEETVTLYANWLQKFKMTFNYGGYAEDLVIGVLENTFGAYPGATTVGDYTIEGWYFDAEYTQPCPTEGQIEFKEDVTFYAKIVPPVVEEPTEYTVTFASGKHATMPPNVQTPITVKAGEKVAEPMPIMMEGTVNGVAGSFVGVWYTDYECTTKFDFDTAVTSDTTLYFNWAEAATVTLYIPYGTNGNLAFKVEKGSSLYDLMKKIGAPESAISTFHFKGWRAQGDNDAILTEEDMKAIIVNNNMGLIAQWKGDMVTVKFDTGVAGMEVESVTIEAGKTFREAGLTLPNLPREGYVLRAWWRTPEFDEAAPFTVEFNTIIGNMTLYAEWEDLRTTASDLPSEPAPHVHSWNPTRQSDSTTHYYVCTGCGAKDEITTHTFNVSGNCTVCGYHNDAAVIAPQPTPVVTPEATPEVEVTPAPEATPAPVDTTITEEKASEDVVEAAKDVVVVEESKATVDKEAVEAIVNATAEGETVILPLAQTTEETVTEAIVNTEALKSVADKETDVVIELSEITVKLDAAALSAVTDQAKGENLEIKVVKTETEALTPAQQSVLENKETAVVVSAQIFSDGEYIGDFKGGKATVMLPFTPDEGKAAEDYKVYFIGEDGELEEVEAKYVDGHMVFTTAHFSDYVIVYETSLTDTPVQPQEPVTEEKASLPILPIIIAVVVLAAGALLLKKKKA